MEETNTYQQSEQDRMDMDRDRTDTREDTITTNLQAGNDDKETTTNTSQAKGEDRMTTTTTTIGQMHHPGEEGVGESCTYSMHERIPRSKSWASQGGIAPKETSIDKIVKSVCLHESRNQDKGQQPEESKDKEDSTYNTTKEGGQDTEERLQ